MSDIDLEAANRLRVAMGLKPIEMPGGPTFRDSADGKTPEDEAPSTVETRQAAAYDNYNQKIKEEEAKKKRKAQKEAIKRARDLAMRDVKMTGKTLGDGEGEDGQDLDTGSWLRQQAKRRKKIENARRLEEELAAREVQAEYTAKDLAGVKVGHEVGQFEAGDEQILTLKDAEIGEESEDDELENVDLRDREKLQERLELKKRKPVYNPNDDDDEGGKGVLAHYDEEIDGKKQHKFTLDGFGSTREAAAAGANATKQKAKGVVISLDFLQDSAPVSDYVEPSEVKIRKPKKAKKSKSTRVKAIDDDDIFSGQNGADSGTSAAKKRTDEQSNFVDDDDLQARLAQQRRQALKKSKRSRPEDVARQLREEEENAMDGVDEDQGEEPGLVLDETSEFVSHLEAPEEREEAKPAARAISEQRRAKSRSASADEDADDDDEDVAMADASANADAIKAEGQEAEEQLGLEEEATIERGIGATLSMLRQRKHVAANDPAHDSLASTFRDHEHFVSMRRAREQDAEKLAKQQRERDRTSGRLDRMSAREREDYARQSNVQREQAESRALADLYRHEYKPNVELKYIDEFGRSMNAKEAFKHMSHQFHGKGSGKQKHDKRLKKIEEERRREAGTLGQLGAQGSSAAMGSKAKRNQQAGVRLQ